MDIHRCRFVPFPPQSINALAFSHASDPATRAPADLRLAVGRGNGDVEVWNPQGGLWVQETTLKGSKDKTIEQLAWTQDVAVEDEEGPEAPRLSKGPLRLFSTGGGTTVTEWDLKTGTPRRHAEGNSGDIWCFAAQPQLPPSAGPGDVEGDRGSQLLAAGCSNGTVVLFSTADDELRYLRAVLTPPVKKPKVLSIAWRDRNTVIAGYDDSTIRVIDVHKRTILRNMSLGKPVNGNNSVVWAVACLPDGTILSGDSSGELKIWDARSFSLVQRLKTHKADILDIATSASGGTIFTIGVDRRTVVYKPTSGEAGATSKNNRHGSRRWAQVSHRRFHTHDVKCATSFESKDLSVLISGGMDASPVVAPIRRWQSELHRRLSHLPHHPPLSSSARSRLFISWWDREVTVYHVPTRPATLQGLDTEGGSQPAYESLTKLVLQGEDNIQDASISADGQFIVACTTSAVKLFQLRKTAVAGRAVLRTRQIDLPPSVARLGARRTGFSPDSKWLYTVRKDNAIALLKITLPGSPNETPAFHDRLTKLYRPSSGRQSSSALGGYLDNVTTVAFSPDSRVLAVGDLSGSVHTWTLEGHEDTDAIENESDESDAASSSSSSSDSSSDSDDENETPVVHNQKWTASPLLLPRLPASILCLSFRPSSSTASNAQETHSNLGIHATRHNPHPVAPEHPDPSQTLVVITSTHALLEFSVSSGKLTPWSRRNAPFLPHAFADIKDRVKGCFWDAARLWMYGAGFLFMLDTACDLPQGRMFHKTTVVPAGDTVGLLGAYAVQQPLGSEDGDVEMRLEPAPVIDRGEESEDNPTNRTKRRKRNTGAGDAVWTNRTENTGGLGPTMHHRSRNGEVQMVDIGSAAAMEENNNGDDDDDGDDYFDGVDADGDRLALLRRDEHTAMDVDAQPGAAQTRVYWRTFHYRSILGIGVLGAATAADEPDKLAKPRAPVEVVIVERHMYDVDQAPRFDGGQEWDA